MSCKKSLEVEKQIRDWLYNFVIDLNLCPFARSVISDKSMRIAVYESSDLKKIIDSFLFELNLIQSVDQVEVSTTLMVLSNSLSNFDEYLSFIDLAEELMAEVGLEGIIQLASFHPKYQFEGESADSVSHFTNRSPYPIVHFLREDMVTQAINNFDNPESISAKNIRTLEVMGLDEIRRRMSFKTQDVFN